jgi:hypothetical protein
MIQKLIVGMLSFAMFGVIATSAAQADGPVFSNDLYPLDVSPCSISPHVNSTYLRVASFPAKTILPYEVCSKPVPKEVHLSRITCMVYSSSTHPDVGGTRACGGGDACPYAHTWAFGMRFSPNGSRIYCWQVYNNADHQRDFSISVARASKSRHPRRGRS